MIVCCSKEPNELFHLSYQYQSIKSSCLNILFYVYINCSFCLSFSFVSNMFKKRRKEQINEIWTLDREKGEK